jgi:hypothetical protein
LPTFCRVFLPQLELLDQLPVAQRLFNRIQVLRWRFSIKAARAPPCRRLPAQSPAPPPGRQAARATAVRPRSAPDDPRVLTINGCTTPCSRIESASSRSALSVKSLRGWNGLGRCGSRPPQDAVLASAATRPGWSPVGRMRAASHSRRAAEKAPATTKSRFGHVKGQCLERRQACHSVARHLGAGEEPSASAGCWLCRRPAAAGQPEPCAHVAAGLAGTASLRKSRSSRWDAPRVLTPSLSHPMGEGRVRGGGSASHRPVSTIPAHESAEPRTWPSAPRP